MNSLKYILLIAILSISHLLMAQRFEATINNTTVSQGKPFEIRFTLYDAKGKNFMPPDFSNLIVRAGPNRSSNMQWVNGDMSSSVSYSYYLQSDEVGEFVITSAKIEVKGEILETKSIKIEVIEGEQTKTQIPGTQSSPSNQQPQGKSNSSQPSGSILRQIEDNAYIQVAVSKSNVFQSEPLSVTFKLIHKLQGSNFGVSKNPSLNGFWVEDRSPDQISFKREVINGVQYQTALIKSATIYPQRAGKLEIDPMEIDLAVRVGRSFFDNRVVEHTIKSGLVSINVLPLPVEGRPLDFSGAVGSFSMTSSVDQDDVEIDEPITFKMRITGNGNMKMIQAPELDLSKDFEVYDPKVSQKRNSKTFEYLIIPRLGGQYKLEPFTFSYFDLDTKSYKTLETESYFLNITGDISSTSPGNGSISGIRKEEIELLGEDIRFINTDKPKWTNTGSSFLFSRTFWTITVIPPLVLLSLLFIKRLTPDIQDEKAIRSKRAEKKAEKHLSAAKQHIQNPSNLFYKTLSDSLYGYIGDKLHMDTAFLSKLNISEEFKNRRVTQQNVDDLFDLISKNEMALFAPLPDNITRDNMIEEAKSIIKKIEQEII